MDISAHKFTAYNWAYDSITWQSIENLSNYGLDGTSLSTKRADASYGATASDPRRIGFDITSAVTSWTSGVSPNYGIGLRYEPSSTNLSVLFYSDNSQSGYDPYIRYSYITTERECTFTSYYDETFTDYVSAIPDALDFVDLVFQANFGISFSVREAPQLQEDLIKEHHINDYDYFTLDLSAIEFCNSSPESCSEEHHKDTYALSAYYGKILEAQDAEDEIIILWTAPTGNVYCNHESDDLGNINCDKPDDNALSSLPFAVVHNANPVIHILRADETKTEPDEQSKSFALLLLHETAHTFGLDEQHYDQTHSESCVMDEYNANSTEILYNRIELYPQNAFCESCKNKLLEKLWELP